MRDYQRTVISQYAASPTLNRLIGNLNQYLDQTENIEQFYNLVWNVQTAQGYGLDVWGRIVGVSRALAVATGSYLGFEEAADTNAQPFNQAPFYSGTISTSNYVLSDTAFQTLIYAKALANISNGSIQSINAVLRTLFPGRGNCYVTDGENMTMTYTFSFALQPYELTIVQSSGVLPKPTGVSVTVVHP